MPANIYICSNLETGCHTHTKKKNEYLDSERIEEKGGYNLSWFCGRNVYSWVKEEKKPNVKISAMQTVLG